MKSKINHRRRTAHWLVLCGAALVLLGAVQMIARVDRLLDLNAQVAEAQVRLQEAQETYDEKLATIDRLDNPAYIERVARENLGMVKEGETIVSSVKSATYITTSDEISFPRHQELDDLYKDYDEDDYANAYSEGYDEDDDYDDYDEYDEYDDYDYDDYDEYDDYDYDYDDYDEDYDEDYE